MVIRRFKRSAGATFIEALIALPLFLLMGYGMVYLSLYFLVQANLDHAASQELSIVSTGMEFQNFPPPDCTNSNNSANKFCLGITRADSRAVQIATSGFIHLPNTGGLASLIGSTATLQNPNIIWPAPFRPGDSYDQALAQQPIVVEVSATMNTLIPWFGGVTVKGRAAGFRETRSQLSAPVLTDCNGYPIGYSKYNCTGNSDPSCQGEHDWTTQCSCPAGQEWNFYDNACQPCNNPDQLALPAGQGPGNQIVVVGGIAAPQNYWWSDHRANFGCWCPSDAYCGAMYGQAYRIWNDGGNGWSACQCRCAGSLYQGTPGGKCDTCSGTANNFTGENGASTHFTGLDPNDRCACKPRLTDADCAALYPSAHGAVRAWDPDQSCWCICANSGCAQNGALGGLVDSIPKPVNGPPGAKCLDCFCHQYNQQEYYDQNGTLVSEATNYHYDPVQGCLCNKTCVGQQVLDQRSCTCDAPTCATNEVADSGGNCTCPGGYADNGHGTQVCQPPPIG